MEKFFFTLLYILVSSYGFTQSYSRLINHGFDNQHLVKDCQVFGDSMICVFNHICNNEFDCYTINTFDLNNGRLTEFQKIDSVLIGNTDVLIVQDDQIIVSCHDPRNSFNKILINRLSFEQNNVETHIFLENDTIRFINEGILEHNGAYFVWGEGRNLNTNEPLGHLVKLDSTLSNVLNVWYFNRGSDQNHLTNLQVQPDGNLTFIIKSSGQSGLSNVEDSLHLIKVDTIGSIVNEISIEEGIRNINRNFLTLKNGNYVIMNFIETVYGQLQCIDSKNGNVLWRWEFPKGNFNEFNKYQVLDYKEANNGDIIICGVIQEVLDNIWDKSMLTAFAARLSDSGELMWFRRFLVPNETNPLEEGPYHFGTLKRILLRKDNSLCFVGESKQFNDSIPDMQYAWVLALDENDCYKGNCSDTIVIEKRLSSRHKFEIGAKWTYERTCEIPNRVDFVTYEVTDTLTINEMPCYIINNGDTICTEDNKVYALDNRLTDGVQLLYDYDATTRFSFECFEPNIGITEYNVTIESTATEMIADGQLLKVTYVDTFCASGWIGNFRAKVFEGIGANLIEPFPCLDFCNDIATPVTCEVGKLRCFENSTESYRFVNYACDSIWMITSIENIIQQKNILYPNPTDDKVYVKHDSQNLSYILTTIHGQVIAKGDYNPKGIQLPFKGIFLLTLINSHNQRSTQRVVRY